MSCDSASMLIREILCALRPYEDVLTILGLVYATKLTVKSAIKLFAGLKTFVWPLVAKDLDLVTKFGQWAVVTGSTDGIGKAYAHELARRKLNIVLVSRGRDKLEATAADLRKQYGVETCIVPADFNDGRKVYAEIAKELVNRDVGILVNNVGVIYDHPMLFEELSEQSIWEHSNVNVAATTMMTHIVLPQMLKRKRGAIINLASSGAIYPLPMMAVYSATKSYVDYFSQALTYEYANKGVIVQTLCPFYLATGMTKFSNELQTPGLLVPGPNEFVRNAIRTLGRSNHTTGYWVHGIQNVLCNAIPKWMWMSMSVVMHRFLIRNYISK